MEQNNLVIAVSVPYEVEISSTGIPLHESKVEFCIHKQDVRYGFPAKMVTDNKFMFTITDAAKELMNSTLEYRLYVYYGNARFEADTGSFNLIDQEAFDVDMKKNPPSAADLKDKVDNISKKRKEEKKEEAVEEVKEEKVEEVKEEKVEVTPTPSAKSAKDRKKNRRTTTNRKVHKLEEEKPKVTATPPVPTPTNTTIKEAKRILHESIITGKKETPEPAPVEEDVNERIKRTLANLNKTVTPSVELESTPTTEEAQKPKFFDEISRMKQINEKREKNKAIKEAVRKTRDKNKD